MIMLYACEHAFVTGNNAAWGALVTLNFIGELFSMMSLLNMDYSLIGLFLFNVLLTTCYSFFNMSIILLEQEVHKDTNSMEFILIIIGYNLMMRFMVGFMC